MAELSKPWAGADAAKKVVSEADQRAYFSHLGDGIINAKSKTEGQLVADGTSVLRLNPVDVLIRGLLYQLTETPKSFNLADAAFPQPAAGQSRIDTLVWRMDMPNKSITAEVVAGVPAVSPAAPSLSRSLTGVYEEPVWQWRYSGVGMQEADLTDLRVYVGPHTVLAPGARLAADADLGSTADRDGVRWIKRDSGVNGWGSDAPASPVSWNWGPLGAYNWNSDIGAPMVTVNRAGVANGSARAIPVLAGHLYELESVFALSHDARGVLKNWRAGIFMGGPANPGPLDERGKRREISGYLLDVALAGEPAVALRGFWRPTVSGVYDFSTRFAFSMPVSVYSRYLPPSSTLIDHGYRSA